MSAKERPPRHFDRLMRQALHEIAAYRPSVGPHRQAGYLDLTIDDVDAVPVFDRGPVRARRSPRDRP
jgi:hypothetical protein